MPEQTSPVNYEDDLPFCFVCDHPACGSFFNLANSVTEHSQTKMADKLTHLVGEEEFLVVVEETDIICRSCWNILNTMDRLESQLFKLGNTVLSCFEKKYFSPGELFQSAPPLVIVFKKDEDETESNSRKNEIENKLKTDLAKVDEDNDKLIQCAQCNYATEFNAMMVFHMRQHNKIKTTTESDKEEVMNKLSERRGMKRGSKSVVGGSKRGRSSGGVDQLKSGIQGDHTREAEDGFDFLTDDPLSTEMLTEVEALVGRTSERQNMQEDGVEFSIPEALPAGDSTEDPSQSTDDDESNLLDPLLGLEAGDTPEGTFCMLDTNTGKIVQRLRKKPDGSYVAIELMPTDTRAVMQQLEDGTLTLMNLPDGLGEEALSLL